MEERRRGNDQLISDVAYIKATLDNLAGPKGRISKLEDDATRHWWLTVAVAPFLAAIHGILRKVGLDV